MASVDFGERCDVPHDVFRKLGPDLCFVKLSLGNTTAYTYHPGGQPGAGQVASVEDALGQMSYFAYSLDRYAMFHA